MFTSAFARQAIGRRLSPSPSRTEVRHGIQFLRYASRSRGSTHSERNYRLYTKASVGAVSATLVVLAAAQLHRLVPIAYAEEVPLSDPTLIFEKPRRKPQSKEDNRDLISSQHLQVKKSWENPGVHAWGSNIGRVAAPESDEQFIKTPRRIPFFDGVLLRDIKLDRQFGAAIDQSGNLLQWGTGYAADVRNPVITLKGKGLRSLTLSRDRILALADNGIVYSVPVSQDEQRNSPKPVETSWLPFWTFRAPISYRKLEPLNLTWGEKVTSIAGGLEHVLLLTSKGRVFSAAAGSQDFPRNGQLGVPGLTWATRPPGAYDMCHEIVTLHGFHITRLAAGDYHSVVVDNDGRVFSFGDNSLGQLGLNFNPESSIVDSPSLLPIQQLYAGTSQVPKVTGVAAGGSNSYFTIDATRVASPSDDASSLQRLGNVTADTWSCGQGIWGNLGNGRWTHVQATPVRIPTLSGLFEYDEMNKRTVPIRLSRFSVGQTHAAAVMDNVTYVNANGRTSKNDTNWGADVVFFGNNEYFQLGTGKRNNINYPVYIQPLDQEAKHNFRAKEQHRFQITPMKRIKFNGQWIDLEQRVECGRGLTAIYSGV